MLGRGGKKKEKGDQRSNGSLTRKPEINSRKHGSQSKSKALEDKEKRKSFNIGMEAFKDLNLIIQPKQIPARRPSNNIEAHTVDQENIDEEGSSNESSSPPEESQYDSQRILTTDELSSEDRDARQNSLNIGLDAYKKNVLDISGNRKNKPKKKRSKNYDIALQAKEQPELGAVIEDATDNSLVEETQRLVSVDQLSSEEKETRKASLNSNLDTFKKLSNLSGHKSKARKKSRNHDLMLMRKNSRNAGKSKPEEISKEEKDVRKSSVNSTMKPAEQRLMTTEQLSSEQKDIRKASLNSEMETYKALSNISRHKSKPRKKKSRNFDTALQAKLQALNSQDDSADNQENFRRQAGVGMKTEDMSAEEINSRRRSYNVGLDMYGNKNPLERKNRKPSRNLNGAEIENSPPPQNTLNSQQEGANFDI